MLRQWQEKDDKNCNRFNMSFNQGDNISFSMTGFTKAGVPIDLTNQNIVMQIGNPAVLTLTNVGNAGITIGSPTTNGQFTVAMTSTQTAALVPNKYPYECWYKYSGSPPSDQLQFKGFITVLQSIIPVP